MDFKKIINTLTEFVKTTEFSGKVEKDELGVKIKRNNSELKIEYKGNGCCNDRSNTAANASSVDSD